MRMGFVFFLMAIFLANPAFADDKIVVTATRSDSPASELPFSVDAVSGETWDLRGATPETALSTIPGLAFSSSGAPGQTRSLFIRGAQSDETLVLVDGIPANDPLSPSRSFDFGQIPLDDIDHIEVIKGPQSVLYGSDGMGGVVQFFSRQDLSPHASVEGGSYGTIATSVSDQGVHAGYSASKGFSAADERLGNTEPDGYRAWYAGGNRSFGVGNNLLVHITTQFQDAKVDTDKNGGPGGDSVGTYTLGRQLYCREENVLTLPNGLEWSVAGSLGLHDRDDNTFGNDYFKSTLWKAESLLRKSIASHAFTGGIEFAEEGGNSSQISGYQRFQNGATYLQDKFLYGRLHGTIGARLDLNSQTETARTYRLGLGYWFVPETFRLKGSVGTGFKAPSLFQIYSVFGTPGLRPERSVGGDLGLEWDQEDWQTELTAFANRYRDLIQTQTAAPFKFFNTDQAETHGLEWLLERRLRLFKIQNAFTLLRAYDLNTNLPLLRRPRYSDTLSFGFRKGDFVGLELLLRYVGRRDDIDPTSLTGARQPMPPFTVLGLNFFHHLDEGLRVVGRVDNLFNRHYEETAGFGVPALSVYGGIEADL